MEGLEYVSCYKEHTAWLHPDRAAGGDRHHRHLDRAAAAGGPEGPRSRQSHELPEQPEADRAGGPQLQRHLRDPAALLWVLPGARTYSGERFWQWLLLLAGVH